MGYSRNGSIEIKFSENITAGTSYRNITVMNLATNKYVIIGKSISGNTLTLKTRIRSSNTWYQVKIPSKSVRDGPGKSLQNNYTFKFKTGTQLD
jgi:hypothetical protein